jgi:hypothetical protein
MSPIERREDVLQQGMAKKPEGFMGKLGHGLGMAGRIAGDIFAPAETELVVQGLGKEGIGPRANEFRNKEMLELEAEKSKEGLEGAQAGLAGATQAHTEAETPEVAPEAEARIGLENAQVEEHKQAAEQGPSLASAYAHAVNQAIAAGHDPAQDPIVQHLSDAITSLQKQAPDTRGIVTDLKIGGQEHNVLVDPTSGKTIADLGLKGEKPPVVRVSMSGGGAGGKEAAATRTASYKAYQPALDSAERFDVMAQNYEDAVKNHDQQAMLSLLYNHMGMTMGLQKGARMTQALIQEAQQSQPWLRNLKAHYDSNGYLSGVVLSQPQMLEMVHNAQGRYQGDVKKSRSEAQYMGATDDGPKRDPNEATQRYYLSQTGGDANKARALMRNDGWTF